MSRKSGFSIQISTPYPTRAVMVLGGGIILIKAPLQNHRQSKGQGAKPIKELSRRSLDRLALVALSTATLFSSILTVSYGANYPVDGKQSKLHLKKLLQYLGNRGCVDYLWFAEFQTRNAPHFHLLLDFGQSGIEKFRYDVARFWAEMVAPLNTYYSMLRLDKKTGELKAKGRFPIDAQEAVYRVNSHPKQWEILRSADGGARYAMKYAMKKEQKKVPQNFQNMGRFWGTPHHLSLPKLVKTWTYTDEDGVIAMCEKMGRDFSGWQWFPKIILGNTDEICRILQSEV
jgi:hypothetical protein